MKRLVTLFICILALLGCATHYQGPKPNFGLRGPEGKRELEEFTLSHNSSLLILGHPRMGPSKKSYYITSIVPLIDDISPATLQMLYKAERYEMATKLLALAAAIVVAQPNVFPEGGTGTLNYAIIGSFLGFGLYSEHLMGEVYDQYNQDLKRRFGGPRVSMNFSF